MSTAKFRVTEHIIPACYVREYAGSTVDQEDVLHLHIKQYTPRDLPDPVPADAVTIIAAHAVGFPKVNTPLSITIDGSEMTRHRSSTSHYGTSFSYDPLNPTSTSTVSG